MVGAPEVVVRFFYREIHFMQRKKQKKIAFIFFSQCYLVKCNLFYIYYFPANFAGSAARVTTNI